VVRERAGASVAARVLRAGRGVLRLLAYAVLALVVWIVLDLPLVIDRWLDVSETPVKVDAIVCLAGGITSYNTPLGDGWDRVYTATQLFADEFAPYLIFTGRGSGTLSEAEIYRDAALWFGVPETATVSEPGAQSTAEHPGRLLTITLPNGVHLSRETPLLLVTSDFHARRVLMTFRKAGFRNVRVVAQYWSGKPGERHKRTSADARYSPSGKAYNDPMARLGYGSGRLMTLSRELAAIGWYRVRGVL
jgi:uncharacterized SAM-binding protein YcdF (DUF218 family)